MTTQKKNYTLQDIGRTLDNMDNRLRVVEGWKDKVEIGKAAVSEYIQQQTITKTNKERDSMFSSIKDITPYVILVLGAVAALLYAHAGGK